jgi:ubiquinol-cytochrome c reductase iron-sulfur subunit
MAVGAGAMVAWPLINQMNPAADTLALSTIEFDVSKVQEGQQVVITWQGKPVFVRYRTAKEINEAANPTGSLKDPQPDSARVKPGHSKYLVVHRFVHPPGLYPDLRFGRVRRLVLPVPRLALRHLGPHS